jgi:YVTN family beta-propeller protein
MRPTWHLLAVAAIAGSCTDSAEPSQNDRTHPTGTVINPVAVDSRPFGIAATGSGIVLVTRLDVAKVTRLELDGEAVESSIDVGNIPTDVAVNPAGTTAYVTNQGSQSVGVIDIAAGSQTLEIPVNGDPFRVVVSPNGAVVLATTNTHRLIRIDPTTRTVTGSLQVGADPNGVAITADGQRAFVAGPSDGSVSIVNLGSLTVAQTVAVGGQPQEVVLSPDESELYVARLGGPVQVLRTSDLSIITSIPNSDGAFGMALSPDGRQLYATITLGHRIAVIDRATRTVVLTINTGGFPRRVRFSRSGETAVVADEAGAVVFIR